MTKKTNDKSNDGYRRTIRLCFLDSIVDYFEKEFVGEDPTTPLFSVNDVIAILNHMQTLDMTVFIPPKDFN